MTEPALRATYNLPAATFQIASGIKHDHFNIGCGEYIETPGKPAEARNLVDYMFWFAHIICNVSMYSYK